MAKTNLYAPKVERCAHNTALVNDAHTEAKCALCGEELDPVDVLARLSPRRTLPEILNPSTHYNENEEKISSIDPSWAKAALSFRTGIRFGHHTGELKLSPLIKVWEQLEIRKKQFESDNTMAILQAIQLCAEENMPLPSWLALAFISQFKKFLRPGGAMSLDEVFISEDFFPLSPMHAQRARTDWKIGLELWEAVWIVAEKHTSLDAALDEVLGNKKGKTKGKTKARELVLMIDKNQREFKPELDLKKYFKQKREKRKKRKE